MPKAIEKRSRGKIDTCGGDLKKPTKDQGFNHVVDFKNLVYKMWRVPLRKKYK